MQILHTVTNFIPSWLTFHLTIDQTLSNLPNTITNQTQIPTNKLLRKSLITIQNTYLTGCSIIY